MIKNQPQTVFVDSCHHLITIYVGMIVFCCSLMNTEDKPKKTLEKTKHKKPADKSALLAQCQVASLEKSASSSLLLEQFSSKSIYQSVNQSIYLSIKPLFLYNHTTA